MNESVPDTVSFLFLMGVTGMLVLVAAMILFVIFYQKKINAIHKQKEKDLTQAAIKAEEEERSRIAGELHDDVGAMLASVKLNVHQAEEDGSGSEAFRQSQKLIDDTIDKVRKMSRSLQPALLQHLGLVKALRAFFDMFALSDAITMHYTPYALPELPEDTSLSLYRILQELVNNTLKHADATEIWLQHEWVDGQLTFKFTHNGQGITQEKFQEYTYKQDAIGLKNIVNRLNVLNGSIRFEHDDKLYHTFIQIPA